MRAVHTTIQGVAAMGRPHTKSLLTHLLACGASMKNAVSVRSHPVAWTPIRSGRHDSSINNPRTARDWDYHARDSFTHLSKEELRSKLNPNIADDLPFNIRFERLRMEMDEIVAAFLFDIHPRFYSLIEEGSLTPSQAQFFKMLLTGFSLDYCDTGLINDSTIFSTSELEFKLLRMYAHADSMRRRFLNNRIYCTLQNLAVPANKIDRQRLIRIVLADTTPIKERVAL